ncbi:hypothetical protein JOB18_003747 [Solea senegalensis]|nr:integrin beta-1-like [Solea senegalensis]KAG7474198.1 hypothetical protein JOB18_003747 [Solea senegalensis]
MAVKLLCLCLLLTLLYPSWAKKHSCPTSASSCDQCLMSGPECAWCTAPNMNIRCHNMKGLRRMGCRKSHTYNPQGEVQIVRNITSSESEAKILFLQPQEVSLRLRPGVSQIFHLTLTMPADQPVPELTTDASNVPEAVNITFSNADARNPLLIQVNVVAAQCPSKSDDSNPSKTGPWSVSISPRGSSLSVKLEITLECQCDCTGNREENSRACSGHGALMCGQCECYNSYTGQQCQRNTGSLTSHSQHDDYCRSAPDALVCSGVGVCVEGFCECEMRENPEEMYSGRYCECSNFDCLRANNKICGGQGQCSCGKCICKEEWTGEDCSCSMETAPCMATNQQLCNGQGMCQCGQCKCDLPYSGPTCESCPFCENTCQQHVECVECRAFGMGEKKDRCDQICGYLGVTMVETKDDLPQQGGTVKLCKMRSQDDCFFYYSFSHTSSGGESTVARSKDCGTN